MSWGHTETRLGYRRGLGNELGSHTETRLGYRRGLGNELGVTLRQDWGTEGD